MPSNAPFFIVGSGRSGTTLLRLILCGHSRLHIPPETRFISDLVSRFPLDTPLSPDQVKQAANIMAADYRWPDMDMTAEDLHARAASLNAPRLTDLIDLPYLEHLRRVGKPRFGDKSPPYIAIVPQLMALYPDARFIHLIRDGRDVTVSFVDAGFSKQGYRSYHRNFEWSSAIRLARQFQSSPDGHRILDVRYEELVRDQELLVRRVCDFLGETFEPDMLRYRERTDLVPTRERKIHGNLDRPISEDSVAVWRRKLSSIESFAIESFLRDDLDRLGYPPRYSSPVWWPLQAATAATLRMCGPLLDRGIPALERRGIFRRRVYV